jgi:hypothetical protein
MSVAKILRASGALDKIVNELGQFRLNLYDKTVFLRGEGGTFFHAFSVFQTVTSTDNIFEGLAVFFREEALIRCEVSASELSLVNLSAEDIAAYYANLQIIRDALGFPFVFLREYTLNQPVEASPCDGFREDVGAFLRACSVISASLETFLALYSFHVLGNTEILWEIDRLRALRAALERIGEDAAALAASFRKMWTILS